MHIIAVSLLFAIIAITTVSGSTLTTVTSHLRDRGGFRTTGYVPTPGSGVTISTGMDLGQQSEVSLRANGVSQTIINKVKPYLGLKTQAAITAAGLKASDLTLSGPEAEQLETAFVNPMIAKVRPYSGTMGDKGIAVLVCLRNWAGSLGNTKGQGKLSVGSDGKYNNYVWDAIKGKRASLSDLKKALQKTLKYHSKGTAGYNQIQHEITYIS